LQPAPAYRGPNAGDRFVANPIADSGFRRTVKEVASGAAADPLLHAWSGHGARAAALAGDR
jgi:hypothetical protein